MLLNLSFSHPRESSSISFVMKSRQIIRAFLKAIFEDNSFFLLPMKIKDPVGHRKALKQFFSEHGGDYDALWFNANDLSNIDILKMAAAMILSIASFIAIIRVFTAFG